MADWQLLSGIAETKQYVKVLEQAPEFGEIVQDSACSKCHQRIAAFRRHG
ncbi:hypothetical protein RCO48_01920 [Peribacillus frigoritolerans]|nr:hypothetical protein [Peribacillus frigoritolerans]